MNVKLKPLIFILGFLFLKFQSIYSQEARFQYGNQAKILDERFDCEKNSPCLISFRADYKEYLDLKYNYKKKLVYLLDNIGYYYFAHNPRNGKFDLKVRVPFQKKVFGSQTIEIGIDTETQSGQVNSTNPNWKYLLSETPTLSPVVNGEQIFISADHPVEGGKLYSVNAKNGKLNWFFLTPGAILAYPFIFEKYLIILDDSGNIFWVDKETGLMRFKYKMEEFPVPNPVLKNNILYLVGKRGHLYAIKLYDGLPVWNDLALVGDVMEMSYQNRGLLILGGNKYWIFDYLNGAKQER